MTDRFSYVIFPLMILKWCVQNSQILTTPTSFKVSVGVYTTTGASGPWRAGLSPHSTLKEDTMMRTCAIKSCWFNCYQLFSIVVCIPWSRSTRSHQHWTRAGRRSLICQAALSSEPPAHRCGRPVCELQSRILVKIHTVWIDVESHSESSVP